VNIKEIKQAAKVFDLRDKEYKDFSETRKLFGLQLWNERTILSLKKVHYGYV
jgi:hypothetical protein